MKIAVRMEGGLGDHILGNRFIPAILDEHPNSEIHLFSDTNGSRSQSEALLSLYNYYKSSTLVRRKSENYTIKTQFGKENFPQHINNITEEDKSYMLNFDKFYNLHIDKLDWMDYDFNWQNYFYHFPKPHNSVDDFHNSNKYIVMHIASDNMGNNHRMSKSYYEEIIKEIPREYDIFFTSTKSTENYINETITTSERVMTIQAPIMKIASLIKNASGLLAIDSGLKYLGYTFNTPTIGWAKECTRPHSCPSCHHLRWLTFPQLFFPLNFSAKNVVSALLNLISSNNYILNPTLTGEQLCTSIIKRTEV